MTTTSLADFHGFPLQIIDHNNERWMTGEQIGTALGVKHARRAINGMFNRHKAELEPFSTVTNIMTEGGKNRETRIYNSKAMIRFGMWITTDKAELFRTWVTEVIETRQATDAQLLKQNKNLRKMALRANPLWKRIDHYLSMGLCNAEIGRLLDCTGYTISKHRREMEQCGLIEPPKNLMKLQNMASNMRGAK